MARILFLLDSLAKMLGKRQGGTWTRPCSLRAHIQWEGAISRPDNQQWGNLSRTQTEANKTGLGETREQLMKGRALLGSEKEIASWRSGGRVFQAEGPASAKGLRLAVLRSEGTALGDDVRTRSHRTCKPWKGFEEQGRDRVKCEH